MLYPVLLRMTAGDDAGSVGEVTDQLATVPRNGIGYGLLRYSFADPEVRSRLAAVPTPGVAVNYMGGFGFDEVVRGDELFDVCAAPYGPCEDPTGAWPYRLDLTATMLGRRLRLDVNYSTAAYRPQTARALLDAMTAGLLGLLEPTDLAPH